MQDQDDSGGGGDGAEAAPGAEPRQARSGRLRGFLKDALIVGAVFFALRAYQQRDLPDGQAPSLTGIGIDGQALSLQDYRGAPVLVHFWATWCGVCKAEAPNISVVAADLPVLSIASHSGSRADVSAYMREHDLSWTTLWDPRSRAARRFGVNAYPTTFVLDGEGRIRHVEVGYTTTLGLRARMWLAGL